MRLDTLRARVVTWYVGLLAAALMVFGATLYFGVKGYLRSSLERSLVGEAKAIGYTFLAFEEAKGPTWMSGEINEAYAPQLSGRFIRVMRRDGLVLYQSGDTRDPVIVVSAVPKPDFSTAVEDFRLVHQPGSYDLLMYTQPFRSSSGVEYVIQTGSSVGPIQPVLSSLRRIVFFLTPLTLILAALGGQMLMRLPLRPLVVLSERAEQIGMSKLGERLPVLRTHDELERLALSLNRMIERLEGALSLNRRFSADVSHELRTPLTIMRGELEQIVVEPNLKPSIHSAIGSALEEIARMSKIVDNLLAIARLDSGPDAIDPKICDLSALCYWVVEQMHPLAEERQIDMRVRGTPLTVLIDVSRIKQVLVNLIDNAIKYTQPGGSVELISYKTDTMAIVEVTDTGIGISSAELPHVFDRFFRADRVRSRSSGGAGLGLSIVKAICSAHGGAITLQSSEGVGTIVRIQLPLSRLGEIGSVPKAHTALT